MKLRTNSIRSLCVVSFLLLLTARAAVIARYRCTAENTNEFAYSGSVWEALNFGPNVTNIDIRFRETNLSTIFHKIVKVGLHPTFRAQFLVPTALKSQHIAQLSVDNASYVDFPANPFPSTPLFLVEVPCLCGLSVHCNGLGVPILAGNYTGNNVSLFTILFVYSFPYFTSLNGSSLNLTTFSPNNTAPVAIGNATRNFTICKETSLILSVAGSTDADSGPLPLTYFWTSNTTGFGSGSALLGTNTSSTTTANFTADANYTIYGYVGDSQDVTGLDFNVSALNCFLQADAGPDQTVPAFSTVALNASASFDPKGNPLAFVWTQTFGQNVDLFNVSGALAYFVANFTQTYIFEVNVSNGLMTEAASTTVRVIGSPNPEPIADAGDTVDALISTIVVLNGSASYDPDGGPQPLTYNWTLLSGPGLVTIVGATSAIASFVPATVGTYYFRLRIFDGVWYSQDLALIRVWNVYPFPPIAGLPVLPPPPPTPPDLVEPNISVPSFFYIPFVPLADVGSNNTLPVYVYLFEGIGPSDPIFDRWAFYFVLLGASAAFTYCAIRCFVRLKDMKRFRHNRTTTYSV